MISIRCLRFLAVDEYSLFSVIALDSAKQLHATLHFPKGKVDNSHFRVKNTSVIMTFRDRDVGALEFVAFGALRPGRGSVCFI